MKIYQPFPAVILLLRVDSHVLLTRSPRKMNFVRLACVKHTASVYPEPESNSPFDLKFLQRFKKSSASIITHKSLFGREKKFFVDLKKKNRLILTKKQKDTT